MWAINPTPHASCSLEGLYKPCLAGLLSVSGEFTCVTKLSSPSACSGSNLLIRSVNCHLDYCEYLATNFKGEPAILPLKGSKFNNIEQKSYELCTALQILANF